MKHETSKEPTILIIRMSALGDVAMTIPIIYSLASQYPRLKIKVLTQQKFSNLFILCPANVSFIFADLQGEHHGIAGLCRLIKMLLKSDIDRVADFHNILRSLLIDICLRMTGKKVVIVNKQRFERRKLTRRNHKLLSEQRNYIARYADVLARLGYPVQLTFKSLFEKGISLYPLPPVIPKQKTNPWIGIAPFARYPNKIYPLHLMEEVVRQLSETYSVFLFGGGNGEKKILQEWAGKYPSVQAIPGLLTFIQELSLMAQLDVMVSMDSANMHLASLVGIPVVSVWGATTPHCGFLGWGQDKKNAVYAGISCQPCSIAGSKQCYFDHFKCMDNLVPQDIIEKVCEVLSKKL